MERGSAPNRGMDDVYKVKEGERLFQGGGKREVPDGLRKKAGGGKDEDDDWKDKHRTGGGGDDGGDGGGDGRDGVEGGAADFASNDEDDDGDLSDALEGYVDAEELDDWLEDGSGSKTKSLSLREARWEELRKHGNNIDDPEDQQWFEDTTNIAYALQLGSLTDDLASVGVVLELVARLLHQHSRRIKAFQEDPVAGHLEKSIDAAINDRHWANKRGYFSDFIVSNLCLILGKEIAPFATIRKDTPARRQVLVVKHG